MKASASKIGPLQTGRWSLGFAGVGLDGVEGAERVDEGGTGVHGHGDAEGFGDFLFCSAGFEGAVGMEGDTAVAMRGDGYGNGDELTGFSPRREFLELAAERVW
jgi:hypothetical protein